MVTSMSKLEILKILRNLKNLIELSEMAEKSKQAVLFHLKPLLDSGLARKFLRKNMTYYFTSELGILLLEVNEKLRRLESVIRTAGKFFCEHDVSAIPQNMFEELHLLDGCRMIVKNDPYEVHNELEEILFESEWVKGLSSVYHEKFPGLFKSLADGKSVELILTKNVLNIVTERSETLLREYLKHGKMYVCDNAKLAFVVAEKGFALALYGLDGVYDAQNILICRTEDAVRWGLKLFEYQIKKVK